MANTINWFEIPAKDFDRACKFYGTLFNAELHKQDMGDAKMGFFPYDGNGVSGAVCAVKDFEPSTNGVMVYLNGGENLQGMLDKVVPAGGKVVVEKTLITPEIGYFAIFLDTEGNKVAMHSPK